MNKKKLITMIASLAMVAVIGIGATLAYMTQTTDTKENTFTVGRVDASLTETNKDGKQWDDTTDGKNLYPGQSVVKKPIMTILKESSDAYAFLKVEGADALVGNGFIITSGVVADEVKVDTASGFHENWIKVEGEALDGIYRYELDIKKSTEEQALAPLFDLVTYKTTMEGAADEASSKKGKITITGCAVQAEGVSPEKAKELVNFDKK